jgi:hypothetical protein
MNGTHVFSGSNDTPRPTRTARLDPQGGYPGTQAVDGRSTAMIA